MNARRLPKKGFSFEYMIDMLEMLKEPIYYTVLRRRTLMKHGGGFNRMMNWLKSKNYIEATPGYSPKGLPCKNYNLTETGRQFLEMLK